MSLMMTIWQKLVWCSLIGGVAGLVFGIAAIFQPSSDGQQHIWSNLIFGAVLGTLGGLILLGVPATVWVFGKWVIHRGEHQNAALVERPNDAGRWAMMGSTAAVPGAIIGGVAGLALAGLAVTIIGLFSIIGVPWYSEIMKDQKLLWFGLPTVVGAVAGFLGGTFLGSAVGAISGGIRSLSRH
jgi:hypothetical protein